DDTPTHDTPPSLAPAQYEVNGVLLVIHAGCASALRLVSWPSSCPVVAPFCANARYAKNPPMPAITRQPITAAPIHAPPLLPCAAASATVVATFFFSGLRVDRSLISFFCSGDTLGFGSDGRCVK